MIKKTLNIMMILLLLLINVPIVEASNVDVITDEAFIGSMINASQGGQSRGRSVDIERMGSHALGGQRGAGRRLGTTPQRGGDNISWNPSKVDVNALYDDYTDYIINNSNPANDLVIPVNLKLERSNIASRDAGYWHGIVINNNNASYTAPPLTNMANNYVIQLDDNYRYVHILYDGHYMGVAGSTISQSVLLYSVTGSTSWGSTYDVVRRADAQKGNKGYDIRNRHIRFFLKKPGSRNEYTWLNVDYLVFSNSSSFSYEEIEFVHAPNNLPTRQEFISNYTNTFNVEYDTTTNQLVENNTYYTYNINDFSDNSVTINNNYITNNYITIIESDNPDNVSEQLNYTGLFERMITAIKDLPQQIFDMFEDFSGGGGSGVEPEPVEEGKGFWASLFDAITEIVRTIGELLAGIPDLVSSLLEGLLGLVEQVIGLFIPTAEQMQELSESFSGLTNDLSLKFSPITDSMDSVKTVFSSPKSIYDLSYNYQGQTVNVIPAEVEPAINKLKPLLNGAIVLSTFISIYKRFVGREDVIK